MQRPGQWVRPMIVVPWLIMAVMLAGCGPIGRDSDSDNPASDRLGSSPLGAEVASTTLPTAPTTTLPDPADLDWETIYRDLVAGEQAALRTNDREAAELVATGRLLGYLGGRVDLYQDRGFTLDDAAADRTVESVTLAEVVADDHVVLHVTETTSGPEVVRAADGSEVHSLPERSEPSQRIQVDVDLVDGEWRAEHRYYMRDEVGIEPLPEGPPAVSVTAEGHTLDVYVWSAEVDLECMGFDGVRPDGTGVGDWTFCRAPADMEPPDGEFQWRVLPMAGDDAPLVYLAFGSESLDQPIELDGREGASVPRPNGGTLTVWMQSDQASAFEVPGTELRSSTGRHVLTGCGETRLIGPYPSDFTGSFETIDDIADALVERLRKVEWQAGSVEVKRVNRSSFVIWADDVDLETARYVWLWTFEVDWERSMLQLTTVEETRTCR